MDVKASPIADKRISQKIYLGMRTEYAYEWPQKGPSFPHSAAGSSKAGQNSPKRGRAPEEKSGTHIPWG